MTISHQQSALGTQAADCAGVLHCLSAALRTAWNDPLGHHAQSCLACILMCALQESTAAL